MIDICHEETRLTGDPECSSDEEIDKYLKNKKLRTLIMEKYLNLQDPKLKFD